MFTAIFKLNNYRHIKQSVIRVKILYAVNQHVNHPCAIWVRESRPNWLWLRDLAEALNTEYRYRYDQAQDHKSWTVIQSLVVPDLPDLGLTEHAQAMPDLYRIPHDPISAYRQFYLGEKQALLQWKKRKIPEWAGLSCEQHS